MSDNEQKDTKNNTERKEHRPFEGRRITQQLPCQQHPPKHKIKYEPTPKSSPEVDTFRTLLSKRDKHKESQLKIEHRPYKRTAEEVKQAGQKQRKESSKSRQKSKGLIKSKSSKLVKKSKSMIRLEPKREYHKEERKSQSPPLHGKSTTSHPERKQCKSNYNSKTTRQMIVSQITTERQKSKSRGKLPKPPKKVKGDLPKKSSIKYPKKKTEKQNIKMEEKKTIKIKKQKRVLISEQHSKVRRECEEWELSNEDQFLDPRQPHKYKNSQGKHCNIVELPKRKERLSLNANHPRKPSLKNKTEAQLESHRSHKKELENWAATRIQKVFRGYLTRKYIKQCFEHNAAVKIQKVWKGYRARKMFKQSLKRKKALNQSPPKHQTNSRKIVEQEEYLLQKEDSKSNIKSSAFNERWASILQEILSEESVNSNIKRKIEFFLESQQKEPQEFQLHYNKSPSARSSISSQVINNEIASERHFLQQERLKKKSHDQHLFLSPKEEFSQGRMYSSPQGPFCSPQNKLRSSSPARSSTELLITNLKSIQRVHRDRLHSKANDEKEQLNSMLIKNKMSPRTHQKKYKEVDLILENQLEKFNESINEIVKNCMLYGDDIGQEAIENVAITPKKELTPLQRPNDFSPQHYAPKVDQMSQELREYYQVQRQTAENVQIFQSFDTSYQFIEEYLISLIDFVRQFEDGGYLIGLLAAVHKPISLQMETIFSNLKLMTQNEEEEENQNSFRLPMYKYIDLEENIIDTKIIDEFNTIFPKLQHNELRIPSSLQESFVKMIGDSMNEALNALRPRSYPFVQAKLSSLNVLKGLQRIPFQCESSEQQMQYQYICAQALNKIFYWNKVEWGKIVRLQDEGDTTIQTRHLMIRDDENKAAQMYSNEEWTFYEELIEIIGLLTEDIFETTIYEEIASVWETFLEWTQKIGKSPIKINPPNSSAFFLP